MFPKLMGYGGASPFGAARDGYTHPMVGFAAFRSCCLSASVVDSRVRIDFGCHNSVAVVVVFAVVGSFLPTYIVLHYS